MNRCKCEREYLKIRVVGGVIGLLLDEVGSMVEPRFGAGRPRESEDVSNVFRSAQQKNGANQIIRLNVGTPHKGLSFLDTCDWMSIRQDIVAESNNCMTKLPAA